MTEDYFNFTDKLFAPQDIDKKAEALKGIRVLDLSHMIFGPTAAKFLAQYGAEVIKVEVPYQGDYWRGGTYWGKYWKHSNPLWHFINQSKYFVAIDVKKPKGKDLILKLAEKADVVIENFTSGTVEAWGIGYSQVSKINPKVIYASLSTYGQYRPARYDPGLGSCWPRAQAASCPSPVIRIRINILKFPIFSVIFSRLITRPC